MPDEADEGPAVHTALVTGTSRGAPPQQQPAAPFQQPPPFPRSILRGRSRLLFPPVTAVATAKGAARANSGRPTLAGRLGPPSSSSSPRRRGPSGTIPGPASCMLILCRCLARPPTASWALVRPNIRPTTLPLAIRAAPAARAASTVWGMPSAAGASSTAGRRPLLQHGALAAALGPGSSSHAALRPHAQQLHRRRRLVHGHRDNRPHVF